MQQPWVLEQFKVTNKSSKTAFGFIRINTDFGNSDQLIGENLCQSSYIFYQGKRQGKDDFLQNLRPATPGPLGA